VFDRPIAQSRHDESGDQNQTDQIVEVPYLNPILFRNWIIYDCFELAIVIPVEHKEQRHNDQSAVRYRLEKTPFRFAIGFHIVRGQKPTETPKASIIAAPISAGDFTTWMPASSSAFIFSAAVPLPPAMMAPAWPMRRPGGAVWPAMNAT